MYYEMDWQITVGSYQLALLTGVEIHKSVDLLADTCNIALPAASVNKPLRDPVTYVRVEELLRRGDEVEIKLGYRKPEDKPGSTLQTEFKGYLLSLNTDDGTIALECEDALFLMRKPVNNKQFKNVSVKTVAQYLIDNTGIDAILKCTINSEGFYTKFVISNATAYDVLKKLQEETAANIYMRWLTDAKKWELNIHPRYIENHGRVRYSFQQNIENSSLKYKKAIDKKLQVTITSAGDDGKRKEISFGTTGGDKIEKKGDGLSDAAMLHLAKEVFSQNVFDGYEGNITGWLVPWVEPGYSAEIVDEDYPNKDGWYYVVSVTTAFNDAGASRKVQLGIKVAGNG